MLQYPVVAMYATVRACTQVLHSTGYPWMARQLYGVGGADIKKGKKERKRRGGKKREQERKKEMKKINQVSDK